MILSESDKLSGKVEKQPAEELAVFQTLMLEALYQSESAADVLSSLDQSIVSTELRKYVDSFEPRMLEVAIELTKKWGKPQN